MFDKSIKWLTRPKMKEFYTVVKDRFTEAEVGNSSTVVAYYLLLSLFPLIISLGSAIGMAHLDPDIVLPYIKELFPASIYHLLEGTIVKIINNSSGGGLLTVAAIAVFWTASKSVNGLQQAMNKVYGVDQRKNFIVARLFAFGFMFVMLFVLLFIGLVFSVGTLVLSYLQRMIHFDIRIVEFFTTVKWPVTIIVMILVMILIYRVLPNAKITFKEVVPGAIFTTICWLLLSQLFGSFAHHLFEKYSSYGIIGTMMIIMLWLKLTAIIIVMGGVINAIITEWKNDEIEERFDDQIEPIAETINASIDYIKGDTDKDSLKEHVSEHLENIDKK